MSGPQKSHPIVPTSVSPQVSRLVIPAQALELDSALTCRRPLLAASFLQSSGVK